MGRSEVAAAQAIASRRWSPTSYFHPGGMAWEWSSSPTPRELRVGDDTWGIVWCHATGSFLAGQLDVTDVEWLLSQPGDLSVQLSDTDVELIEAFRRAGFDSRGPERWLDMRRSLDDLPSPPVPDGFTLRAITPEERYERAQLHRDVWAPSKVTDAIYDDVVGTPPYRFDLDTVVVAPDGRLAAYALAWFDEASESGELEPVGVHPDFRGLGLSPAVCVDAMRRLHVLGAREAMLHPRGDDAYPIPRRAYASIGFEPVNEARDYTPA